MLILNISVFNHKVLERYIPSSERPQLPAITVRIHKSIKVEEKTTTFHDKKTTMQKILGGERQIEETDKLPRN